MLEHHGQARTNALQLVGISHAHATGVGNHAYLLAVQAHGAVVGGFEKVDATQKRALARTAGADQADYIARLGLERDALEHLVVAVALVQAIDRQFVHAQQVLKAKEGNRCGRLQARRHGR